MSIQTPSPDEIFKVWLNKLDDKTLLKYFKMKNVPLSRKNISAAEFVKKVNKYALFIVKMELPAETKRKTKREKVLKIEGMLFYDHPIEKDVPIFKSLKLVKCEKCNGSGYLACKSCGGRGYITCVKCKGRGEIKCDKCNGRGEIEITIKVEVEEGKRVNKKLKIKCPKCHGKGSVKCDKCGGLGKIKCPDCDGSGREICKECGGVGNIATYEVGKIRAKKLIDTKILFSEEIKKEYREEIIQNLERAESI
ncbi:MAG TPA: hypothetical protein ENG38_02480, partial [Thermoplasmatales archaeon]|nr:hypothetical protein [Thermoplasmatales archaeon]HEX08658.1 hypothetical protein [Thermoplasmatales archaeon]